MNKKTKDTIKPEKDIKKTIDKVDLEEIAPEGPGEFDNVKLRRIPSRGKLTFFYKKNDGVVFAAEEQEAATGKYHKKFELIGWSNGEAYLKTIRDAGLRKNQLISKRIAEKLLKDAFDIELKIAKKNLRLTKKNNERVLTPKRLEWAFDTSVPEKDRYDISRGRYEQMRHRE